jgi:hypothetical protein
MLFQSYFLKPQCLRFFYFVFSDVTILWIFIRQERSN